LAAEATKLLASQPDRFTKQTPNKDQTKIMSFCSLFVWSQIPKNGTGYAQCGHKPNKRIGRIVLTAP
jgi:hypothetical protein